MMYGDCTVFTSDKVCINLHQRQWANAKIRAAILCEFCDSNHTHSLTHEPEQMPISGKFKKGGSENSVL